MNGGRLNTKQYAVHDVMSTPVVTVPANTPVKLVVELMLTHGVSALPVRVTWRIDDRLAAEVRRRAHV